MPKVRFIGTAASYAVRGLKFTQERPVLEVDDDLWAYLKRQRSPAQHRLFMISDDDGDDEINGQQHEVPAGNFLTKKAALDYARDLMEVDLAESLSLEQLNGQTFELYRRYTMGMRGDDLIQGLRMASLREGAEESSVEIERGPGDDPDAEQGDGPEGDAAKVARDRVHAKRGDAHPPKPTRTTVKKPSGGVREIGVGT